MPRKPSLTKQIGDALGTQDKREQLERIQGLIRTAQSPSAAVTVTVSRGEVLLSTASVLQLTPKQIKFILQEGIDEVTRRITLQEMEAKDAMGPAGPPDGTPTDLPIDAPMDKNSKVPKNSVKKEKE